MDHKHATLSTLLQETRVRVMNDDFCAIEVSSVVRYNDNSMICAKEKGTDSCNVSDYFLFIKLIELFILFCKKNLG